MFSVVIPTLNEEKFLPLLLKDLSNQSYKEFEVIVVDGNSEDKTKKEAKKFTKKLKLSIINSKKRNVSYQRNLGASKAKYQYLVFIDADSRINKTFLKKIYEQINKEKNLLLLPLITPEKNLLTYKFLFSLTSFLVEISQALGKPYSLGGTFIINKHLFNLLGGFDEKVFVAEDHDLVRRAFKAGVSAKIIESAKVKMSLRRFKKEGEFQLLLKYGLVSTYLLLNDNVQKKLFEYKMGGKYNDLKDIKKSHLLIKELKQLIK